jgi:hypothetical protein
MSNWKQSLDKISSGSLLISTAHQSLIRFYCPISATCVKALAGYEVGEQVFIDGIYHDENHALLYLIDELKLPHTYFHINNKTT